MGSCGRTGTRAPAKPGEPRVRAGASLRRWRRQKGFYPLPPVNFANHAPPRPVPAAQCHLSSRIIPPSFCLPLGECPGRCRSSGRDCTVSSQVACPLRENGSSRAFRVEWPRPRDGGPTAVRSGRGVAGEAWARAPSVRARGSDGGDEAALLNSLMYVLVAPAPR